MIVSIFPFGYSLTLQSSKQINMKALIVSHDAHRTTEVNLRDTTVTFLNKLMKRVKKTEVNLRDIIG